MGDENTLFSRFPFLMSHFSSLGDRLVVGQRPLKPSAMVRIHVPQPSTIRCMAGCRKACCIFLPHLLCFNGESDNFFIF